MESSVSLKKSKFMRKMIPTQRILMILNFKISLSPMNSNKGDRKIMISSGTVFLLLLIRIFLSF